MFEPGAVVRRIAALVAMACPAICAAQSASQTPTRGASTALANAAVDSLVVKYADARATQARAEAAAVLRLPGDTVRAGALVILTDSSLIELTRRAAGDAWSTIHKTYGAAASVLASERFVVRLDPPVPSDTVEAPPWIPKSAKPARLVQLTHLIGGSAADVLRLPDRQDSSLAIAMGNMAARLMVPSLDTGLVSWLGGEPYALTLRRERRGEIYTTLVLSTSPAAQACIGGSISSCRVVLALDEIGDVVRGWYGSAESRRQLVERFKPRLRLGPEALRFDACVTNHADSVCDALLATVPRDAIIPPLGIAARHDLLYFALARGGAESFPRLLAAKGPMGPRLAAASGVSEDSLIGAWRTSVIASAPPPVTLTPRTAWMALCWIALLGLIATRSSRWR